MNLQKILEYIKINRKFPKSIKVWELFELQKLMNNDPTCETFIEFELEHGEKNEGKLK